MPKFSRNVPKHEVNRLARKMERQRKRAMAEASERELVNHKVIETSDDVRGDLMSLILNAKPDGMTHKAWFQRLEDLGGCKLRTYQDWFNLKVTRPTTNSERITLEVLGLSVYYGTTNR